MFGLVWGGHTYIAHFAKKKKEKKKANIACKLIDRSVESKVTNLIVLTLLSVEGRLDLGWQCANLTVTTLKSKPSDSINSENESERGRYFEI